MVFSTTRYAYAVWVGGGPLRRDAVTAFERESAWGGRVPHTPVSGGIACGGIACWGETARHLNVSACLTRLALWRRSLSPLPPALCDTVLRGIWELRFVGIVRVLCFNTFTPTANVKS